MNIGGIANGIIGTLIIVFFAGIFAIPSGIMVGIYLAENRVGKFPNMVRVVVDMIQGIPSIIFGIVVNIWLVKTFRGYSAISGSIALALMMLPMIIKNTEETLKLVPDTIKEAAMALGTPYYKMVLMVLLPAGISGIITGVLMGIARVTGETAPLLFTSFGSQFMSFGLFEPMETLPTLIFKNSMSPNTNWIVNSWGGSAVLVIYVLLLNILTRVVVNRWQAK